MKLSQKEQINDNMTTNYLADIIGYNSTYKYIHTYFR